MAVKLDLRFKGFDRFIIQRMREWHIPGLAVGIIKNHQLVYAQGFGYRNVNRKLPVEPDTRFLIASCTKAFTATAIGILVDEKKLEWDKPVQQYLPSFRMFDSVATERMTPRDLLSHRSGLPRHDYTWFNNPISKKELCNRLKYLEPSSTPDSPYDFRNKYQYNNIAFIIAGLLIEQLTGNTYETFVQERIFEPLGMTCTTFLSDVLGQDQAFPMSYARYRNQVYPRLTGWLKKVGLEQLLGPSSAAGGIVSNISDLGKWVLLQMNNGKTGNKQIISPASLKELHTQQFIVQPPSEYSERLNQCYGLGWFVETYRGERLIRHSGNLVGFSAYVSFMPEEKFGVVMLSNVGMSPLDPMVPFYLYDRMLGLPLVDWNQRKKAEIKKQELEDRKKQRKDFARKLGTKPSHLLFAYTGEYQHPGYGTVSIVLKQNRLMLNYNEALYRLEHLQYDQFRMLEQTIAGDKYKVTFQLNKSGNIGSIAIPFEPSVKDIVFKRIHAKVAKK